MASGKLPEAEFSRRVPVDGLGEEEVVRQIEATADERKALARRFDLLSLDKLTATVHLRRLPGRPLIRVFGRFEAEATQACVITLEPLQSCLDGCFARCYNLAPEAAVAEREILIDVGEEEPPEPVPAGGIDLGEVVAEHLALEIDPYPRAEGARLEQAEWGDSPDGGERESPFRVLGTLKERK
jgi:uncharacterized metal-binding protein YceD (DUF177 family)